MPDKSVSTVTQHGKQFTPGVTDYEQKVLKLSA